MLLPIPVDPAGTIRVLVVDDDPVLRDLVERTLRRSGCEVHSAESIDEAVPRLRESSFDVVLVDLDLNGRSGLELLDAMAVEQLDAVAVLLTGTHDVSTAVAAMKRGATDYLAKPPSLVELRRTVERAAKEAKSRRREKKLESLVAEWAATFDACPDPMLVLDTDGRIMKANRAVAHFSGRPTGELAGLTPQDVFPGDLGEAMSRTHDGSSKLIDSVTNQHFSISSNSIPAGGTITIARDITGIVRAEATQARLYRRLLTAQEDERGRIARELHDGIAQSIVSLAIGLQTIAEKMDHAAAEPLRVLAQSARETLDEIRGIARGLRPRVLDDLGLLAALERLTQNFTQQYGVPTELIIATAPAARLPATVELTVYRIEQEALTNIAKHAAANSVDVTIDTGAACIYVSVADDGTGNAADNGHGMGIADMRERAELLGGSFHLDSTPARGTTVSFEVPIGDAP